MATINLSVEAAFVTGDEVQVRMNQQHGGPVVVEGTVESLVVEVVTGEGGPHLRVQYRVSLLTTDYGNVRRAVETFHRYQLQPVERLPPLDLAALDDAAATDALSGAEAAIAFTDETPESLAS